MLRLYEIPIAEKIFPYIPYILLSLVTIAILYILYLKSKYKFWFNQYIHNIYDPRLWNKIGIIKDKVIITKYFDPLCYSNKWTEIETEKKELIPMLLTAYYNYYQDLVVKLNTKNIESMFVGHNNSVFVSLYFKNALEKRKLTGCICSKPIEGRLSNKKQNIYFWDYMCRNKNEKEEDFFKLLYTHYKRSRDSNYVKYFLFRTSKSLEIATSLVTYNSYLVSTKFFPKRIFSNCKNVSFVLINSSNYRLVLELFYMLYDLYPCFLHVNIAQYKHLLDSKEMYMAVILLHNKPIACYFYKQIHSYYNNNPTISLIGSYQGKTSDELFYEGFFNSIILVNSSYTFNNIVIDDLNNNTKLISKVSKFKAMEKYKSYYYFYNFAHPSYKSNQVLMLL